MSEEKKCPKIEVIRTHDPEDNMSVAELARKAIKDMQVEAKEARRRREVDGEQTKESLRLNAFCLCRQVGSLLELETVSPVHSGIGVLKARGRSTQECEVALRHQYLRALLDHKILSNQEDALDVACNSTFPSMRADR